MCSKSPIYVASLVFVIGFLLYGGIVGAQDITDPTEGTCLKIGCVCLFVYLCLMPVVSCDGVEFFCVVMQW